MKPKQTKLQRIAELERKLGEALAGQIHTYHFADTTIHTASLNYLTGSGVVLALTALGGRKVFDPVLIRDGLSEDTVRAIKADLKRSYELATLLKPK